MAIEPTFYAFTYEAYDQGEPDEDNYRRKNNSVDITVMAESLSSADKKVAALVTREVCRVDKIVEVSDQYTPLSQNSY